MGASSVEVYRTVDLRLLVDMNWILVAKRVHYLLRLSRLQVFADCDLLLNVWSHGVCSRLVA